MSTKATPKSGSFQNAFWAAEEDIGQQVFFNAAARGDIAVMASWLKAEPKLIEYGSEALVHAALAGKHDAVKFLLEQKADPNKPDPLGLTALGMAVAEHDTQMVRILLEGGADPNIKNDLSIPVLLAAAEAGDVDIAKLLLEHKARIDEKDDFGQTAVMIAAVNGQEDMLRFLKSQQANLDLRDHQNYSALDKVIGDKRNDKIFDLLVELGADTASPDPLGNTPAHRAAWADNARALEKLHDKGMSMTAPNSVGNTPLLMAAFAGAARAAERLTEWQVPVQTVNKDGLTAYAAAKSENKEEVVRVLNRVEAKVVEGIFEGGTDAVSAPAAAGFKKRKPAP